MPEDRATLKKLDKQFGPGAKVMLIAAKLKKKLKQKLQQAES